VICRKCKSEIPDNSVFCNLCGAKQTVTPRKKASRRGNGEGSVYQLKDGKWCASVVVGWVLDEQEILARPVRRKAIRKTKAEALAMIPVLKAGATSNPDLNLTFQQLYMRWFEQHEQRVSESTMGCYKAAYKHYKDLWGIRFLDLGVDDLQNCVDECPAGRRTKENMKALGTLLYDYASSRKLNTTNFAQYIYVGNEKKGTRPSFTPEQVELIRKAIGKIPGADYTYCMIHLGYRPNEMLGLTRDSFHTDNGIEYLVGGFKSEAGTDRSVTISPKIRNIILPLIMKADPYIFPKADGSRMTDDYFRTEVFYPLLAAVGIQRMPDKDHPAYYVPYSCRHTFSNLIKAVKGDELDKASLMGHSDPKMTRQYQDSKLYELKAITDAI
jgi:integrase